MAAQLVTLLKDRISFVWLALIVATLASWWIGADDAANPHLGSAVVLVVAFIKVRYVGCYFMELRNAPPSLRLVFEGYCLVVCAALLGMYLTAVGS